MRNNTSHEPEDWDEGGLPDYFMNIHHGMKDRAFCFILGAGASFTSGIQTGSQLVNRWIRELYHRHNKSHSGQDESLEERIQKWATADNLEIPRFHYETRHEFYSDVFERRYGDDLEEGYAFIEREMDQARPGVGYAELVRIMTDKRHRVVITTNFDNLVADAFSVYTETRTSPMVCGHESLAKFIRPRMRRPLVAKIHRDRLFAPISDSAGTDELAEEWKKALRDLFQNYTPIIIGYGGNDGSLMKFLESLKPGEIVGRMVWCYRKKEDRPRKEIRQLVAKHNGLLVKILGFDELMIQISDKLGFDRLSPIIEEQQNEFVTEYKTKYARLHRKILNPQDTGKEVDWWKWEEIAQIKKQLWEKENDPGRQEKNTLQNGKIAIY